MDESAAPPGPASPRVLIVEDDLAQRILLTEGLRDEGFAVESVASLFDGIEMVSRDDAEVDIIVLDLDLPDSRGAESVRTTIAATDLPVLVYSGNQNPQVARQTQLLGAARFIAKDVPAADLAEEIRSVITTHRAHTPRRPALTASHEGVRTVVSEVLSLLDVAIPMGRWVYSRRIGGQWIVVDAMGDDLPHLAPGSVLDESLASAELSPTHCSAPILTAGDVVHGALHGFSPAPVDLDAPHIRPLLDFAARSLATAIDTAAARHHEERLLSLAKSASRLDALTGLDNRRGLDITLAIEQTRSRRFGYCTTIVAFDIDGLKTVNDRQGHAAGDDLLRRAATAIQEGIRPTDHCFRTGGDEFMVIAPDTAPDVTDAIRERLTRSLNAHDVSASIGVACQLLPSDSLAEVQAEADRSMYLAKRRHRRNGDEAGPAADQPRPRAAEDADRHRP